MTPALFAKVRLTPVRDDRDPAVLLPVVQRELDMAFRGQGLRAEDLFARGELLALIEVVDVLGFPPPGLASYTEAAKNRSEVVTHSTDGRLTPLLCGFRVEIVERAEPLAGGSIESAQAAMRLDEQRARILSLQEEKLRLEIDALRRAAQ